LENHCAAYDVKFLAVLNNKLDAYLLKHFTVLKFTRHTRRDDEYLHEHWQKLLILLNEIIDDLPISLIRGDIIYERPHDEVYYGTTKFIYDGDKVIKLDYNPEEIFPREFIINLDNIPINYWHHVCYDKDHDIFIEGIRGDILLDICQLKDQCLTNIKYDGDFILSEQYSTYTQNNKVVLSTICRANCTQFIHKEQMYYIVLPFELSNERFKNIFISNDTLSLYYTDNNIMFLHHDYYCQDPVQVSPILLPGIPTLI
jgi:hypothetical protein